MIGRVSFLYFIIFYSVYLFSFSFIFLPFLFSRLCFHLFPFLWLLSRFLKQLAFLVPHHHVVGLSSSSSFVWQRKIFEPQHDINNIDWHHKCELISSIPPLSPFPPSPFPRPPPLLHGKLKFIVSKRVMTRTDPRTFRQGDSTGSILQMHVQQVFCSCQRPIRMVHSINSNFLYSSDRS